MYTFVPSNYRLGYFNKIMQLIQKFYASMHRRAMALKIKGRAKRRMLM